MSPWSRYPRWFATLFLTDMWERFSFYGMQAILVLYAVTPESRGGLGLPAPTAAALFGAYMATVFLLAQPGGWLGDRVLGERRAVMYGGCLITAGHVCMALPPAGAAYAGLALIALGTGLLKPSLSALLSRFYTEPARREAAFSVFYMSIQVSAVLAPLVTGFLGEYVSWHAGFAAAAVGMAFGVVQFAAGTRHFEGHGDRPARPASGAELSRVARRAGAAAAVAAVLLAADVVAGTFSIEHVLMALGLVSLVAPPLFLRALRRHPALGPADRRRLGAATWLLLCSALFWMVVSQAGSLLNLFAHERIDRTFLGFTVPAGWLQSTTPLIILVVAPAFAWLWLRLGDRFGVRRKFVLGLLMAGASFMVMFGAGTAADGERASILWLLAVYFLQACGEIALGPVGISAVADAAPPAFRVRMMGLYWLFVAFGASLGSIVVRLSAALPQPVYYLLVGGALLAAAGALAAFGGRVTREFAAPRKDAPEPTPVVLTS
ncbi:peptide transporter [Sphaerisporangium rufum]|uniref:Peptide transporter n=1 Tax=Sphaerisporangium rufum TaxID=1381558 RepID=A0A919RBJ7_9ACTN|nr:oligopeptide:H+ symporter [Sphaerisporangium rufum]GII80962.1 peptide transporter [Sphaerisporangium rufum]